MTEYEIYNIMRDQQVIKVEILMPTGQIKGWVYPLMDGWGKLDDEGELNCIKDVFKRLTKLELSKNLLSPSAVDIEAAIIKNKGRKFKLNVVNNENDCGDIIKKGVIKEVIDTNNEVIKTWN